MEQEEPLAEVILNHALEIICLLTVEDFIVIKRPPDGIRCTYSIRATELNRNLCEARPGCQELFFTLLGMGEKTQKMIAELANKIVRLLAKKVEKETKEIKMFPAQREDVAINLSKDRWRYLDGHVKPNKNNQDTCTIVKQVAPVQQSTAKSYPIAYLFKEETDEEPRRAAAQPTAPVQQSTEKNYPITVCVKEEPDEEPHHVSDGKSTLPPSGFISGSPEEKPVLLTVNVDRPLMEPQTSGFIPRRSEEKPLLLTDRPFLEAKTSGFVPGRSEGKPLLPTLNVHRPLMEAQTSSGFSFSSPCDIDVELGAGGESSDDTIDSVDDEYSQFPTSSDQGHVYNIIDPIKEEPEDSKDSFVTVSVDMISTEQPTALVQQSKEKSFRITCSVKEELDEEPQPVTDGTSTLPSSGFIPGSTEGKPLLPTVNVHRPLMEPQTSSGFGFSSSCDIKPEPGAESSDDTIDSMDEAREQVNSIIDQMKEEAEEDGDLYIPESLDMSSTDEDYLPSDADGKKTRKRKSRSEQKSPPCEVCGKVLGCKSSLDKHLKIHTGERPFTCNDCGKTFSCKNHLTTHERSHAGERPYLCNQCGRRFFKHQHLRLHQVVHTGEKPYSCKVCGKGFTRQSSVVKHSGMHAEKKPFTCTVCGKSYCQYASLIVHQRQHSGEKPFICKHCDKSFACKATMLKHEKAHTE